MTQWQDHIEKKPEVLSGKPVIKGTRISVEMILERLEDGWKEEDLLQSFSQITAQHVRAAQSYAPAAIASDETVSLSEPAA